jgi:hypothetical protein
MKSGFALAALAFGGMSFAQSTVVATSAVQIDGQTTTLISNIDPSDIASLPEPEILGPPMVLLTVFPQPRTMLLRRLLRSLPLLWQLLMLKLLSLLL